MSQIEVLKAEKIYITLNCQSREIKFDLNAYAELEKKYGSVEVALNTLQKGSIIGLRDILWAGIIHSEAVVDKGTGDVIKYNITPHDVGSWIEPSQMKEMTLKITEAIVNTLPTEDKAKAKKELNKALETEATEKVKVEANLEILEKKE